jgi:hypothetical protein
MIRKIAFLTTLIVALTVAAAPALAQTSGSGYSPPASQVQADISTSNTPKTPDATTSSNSPATATKTASASQLPFTGLDVGLLLGAGLALLLVGFALSRLTRSSTPRAE